MCGWKEEEGTHGIYGGSRQREAQQASKGEEGLRRNVEESDGEGITLAEGNERERANERLCERKKDEEGAK